MGIDEIMLETNGVLENIVRNRLGSIKFHRKSMGINWISLKAVEFYGMLLETDENQWGFCWNAMDICCI